MTERALVARKLANARAVAAAFATPGALDPEARTAMLQHLTDLRLVLASRLGIERDGDEGRGDSDADRWMQEAYRWLGAAQWDLLTAIRRLEA